MTLPKEEHHQTSDLEELLAATGGAIEDVPPEVLKTLPAALRERDGEVTVATFGRASWPSRRATPRSTSSASPSTSAPRAW